ncbi:MAG: hypothetical protein ACXVB4_08645 [Pseudobdellovibrionaceae bacterium]
MNASHGIWENNQIYNSTDSNGAPCHPNIVVVSSTSDLAFRNNEIHDYDAEGIMVLGSGTGSMYVYGNLWYAGQTYSRVLETDNAVSGPVYFYNNVVESIWQGILEAGGTWASGSVERNNIYWGGTAGPGLPNADYNFCSGTCTGSNSISNGSNPFVNLTAHDYHIVSTVGAKYPKDKGVTLASPFNLDRDGNTRGADGFFDIGAYEYNNGTVTSPLQLQAPRNLRLL